MATRITVQQEGGARGAKRAVARAAKAGVEAAVLRWHRQYMPEHFTVAGGRKYGYQPRKGDDEPPRIPRAVLGPGGVALVATRSNPHYSWAKRREKGHNKPLVWSGNSEAAAKLSVRVTSRRVAAEDLVRGVGTLDLLPTYFYQYRKDLGQPDKADELTRVTPDEQADLAAAFGTTFHAAMAADAPASAAAVA